MTPRHPIQVYLDSSDYSRLSDVNALETDAQLKPILQYLQQAVSAGHIEIRFSAIHIAEAAQTTHEAQPQALARAKLISALSRQRCLIFWEDLVQFDILDAIFRDRGIESWLRFPAYAYSNDGNYYPDMSSTFPEFVKERNQALSNVLEAVHATPAQRNFLKKELALGERSELVQLLLKQIRPSTDELLRSMPVTERFKHEKFLERFVFGGISTDEFLRELFKGFTDPEVLVSDVLSQLDQNLEFSRWFRNQGKALKAALLGARDRIQYLRLLGAALGKTDNDLRCKLKDIEIDNKAKQHVEKIITEGLIIKRFRVSRKSALRELEDRGYEKLSPAYASLAWTFKKYAQDNMSNFVNPRTTLESDVGDMFHSVYMPYVDVFRADGYFANLLKVHADKLGVRLAGKLTKLPDIIEELRVSSDTL